MSQESEEAVFYRGCYKIKVAHGIKTILQNFIRTSHRSVHILGPVQVYRGGVNRIYQGPLPTVPGLLKVPLELAKHLVLGFLPRVQREGLLEKERGGWRQSMDIR